ncbi:chloride channel [Aureococcus anophagefferens]|nr:chloride channel [Aureococcus anophagefferens]
MREWSAIAAAAGAPAPRLAEEKERLFGAAKPKVVFWRDNSMWCPYCARLWLLLEALRVPYTTKTIPLSRYLKPGEKKPAEYRTARSARPSAGRGPTPRARWRDVFGAIASDRTTLARTNLRYANPHFAPDAGAARLIDHEGVACTAEDRRDAAARLAKNHAAVAKFALRAASADNRPDETLVAAVDDALRPRRTRSSAATPACRLGAARRASRCPANVGVPRDMARGPAAAFRGALRDLAAQQATPPRAPDGKWETAGNGDCWLKFTWCLGAAVGVGSSARLCGW